MKKLLSLAAFFAVLTFAANAQTEQGKIVVSGKTGLDFTSTKFQGYYDGEKVGDSEKTSNFSFTPSVGYFVIDNLAVGLGLSLDLSKDEDDDTQTTFAVTPGVTYYFPLDGMIKPFLGANVGFASSTTKSGSTKEKTSGLTFGGGAGVAFFLKDNVSLDLGLGYQQVNLKDDDDKKAMIKAGGIGASLGFSLFF